MADKSLTLLRFFYDHRGQEFGGADIMEQTRLWAGTMYAFLYRFEDEGILSARWEVLPEGVTRPRRRFYTLSPKGEAAAYFRLGLGVAPEEATNV
jgi:DNA-binding PadR family transcriptional regulator